VGVNAPEQLSLLPPHYARLRPFFSYFGSKWAIAGRYHAPVYDTIIEPFAGSAGYSLRYPAHRVVLYDKSPVIVGIWRYLITADPAEILALPDIEDGATVADYDLSDPQRWLIGFWVCAAAASPQKTPTGWTKRHPDKNYWGPRVRARLASQVPAIRHWRAECLSYQEIPNQRATWLIDPPYKVAGKHYPHGSRQIDYAHLGAWCGGRRGQVIACEQTGADWLPFEHLTTARSASREGGSAEAVWNGGQP
jgi:hypothetical protein